jgi:hypothetical protein
MPSEYSRNLAHLVEFLLHLLLKGDAVVVLSLRLWYAACCRGRRCYLAKASATFCHFGPAAGLTVRSHPSPISSTGRSSRAFGSINPDQA